MQMTKAKTILSKVKYGDEWYGVCYNMNLYRGCSHGCIYCDSRSECYHVDDFDVVKGKLNALEILNKELSKTKDHEVVGIGSMSDPYNPQESKYGITRGALKLLSKHNHGVSINTKSDLILRDLDVLKEINDKNNVIIKFTITTFDDALSKIIEPWVCVSSRRFKAAKTLSENGIFTGIMLNPVLPFITDSEQNVRNVVKLAHESGAKFISTYMSMTLRNRQRDHYFEMLDKKFPGLKEKYKSIYTNRYACLIPNHKKLYKIFKEECDKYDILYNMKDIIKAYKKDVKADRQLTLFDNI